MTHFVPANLDCVGGLTLVHVCVCSIWVQELLTYSQCLYNRHKTFLVVATLQIDNMFYSGLQNYWVGEINCFSQQKCILNNYKMGSSNQAI